MQGKFAFYAAHSGLAAGTLSDHMAAYWRTQASLPDDADTAIAVAQNRDRYTYWTGKAPGSGTANDAEQAFYLAAP